MAKNFKTATKKSILNFFRKAFVTILVFLLMFATWLLTITSFLWYPFFVVFWPKNAARLIYDKYPICDNDTFEMKILVYTSIFMFKFLNRGWLLIFNSFITPMKIRRWFINFNGKPLNSYSSKTQVKYFFAATNEEQKNILLLNLLSAEVFNIVWEKADVNIKKMILSSIKMTPSMIKTLKRKEYHLVSEYCKQKTLSVQCMEALIKCGKNNPTYMEGIVFNIIKKQGMPEDIFRKIPLDDSEYSKVIKKAIREYLDLQAVGSYSLDRWAEYLYLTDDVCIDAQKCMNEQQYLMYRNSHHRLSKEALIELLRTTSPSFLEALLKKEWKMLDENDEYYLKLSQWKYKIYKEIGRTMNR